MKLCIDCFHYIPPHEVFNGHPDASNYARCRKSVAFVSLVDGHTEYRFCDLSRSPGFGDHCGPDATYWEAKP
jgi:hypothetical protein